MKKRIHLPTGYLAMALLALCHLTSCEFQPEGDNFVEIDPVQKSELTRYEITDIEDGLLLTEPIELSYSFAVTDGKFYLFEAVLDRTVSHQEIFKSEYPKGVFTVDPAKLYPNDSYGRFDLVFTVYTNTNTGSMADVVGAEVVAYQLKKEVVIDRRPPADIPFEASLGEEGIVVEFGEYPYANLVSTTVYASYDPATVYAEDNKVITLARGDSTAKINSYVGGKIYIGAIVESTTSTEWNSPHIVPIQSYDFLPAPKIVKKETLKNGLFKVYWSKPPIAASFRSYQLLHNNTLLAELSSINDTAAVLNDLVFGRPYEIELKTTGSSGIAVFDTDTLTLGNPFPSFYRLYVDKEDANEKLIYTDLDHRLFKESSPDVFYDGYVEEVALSKKYNLVAVLYSRRLLLLDYNTLAVLDEITLNDIFYPSSPYSQRYLGLSILNERFIGFLGPVPVIYDYIDNVGYKLGVQYSAAYYFKDSNTLFTPGGIFSRYTLEASGPVYDTNLFEFSDLRYSFTFNNYLLLSATDNNEIKVYSAPNLDLVGSYTLGIDKAIAEVDHFTSWGLQHGFTGSTTTATIIDLLTGERLFEVDYFGEVRLINGVLYHQNGLSIEFDR
ncbi:MULTISPECIES: hypothetical protein [unclassified Imperialibacter]|uniref:hypothetical protein n=1 Tax=unclassified Imperialibacter TaxID=2629706 RepID=UPI00125A63A1|nr:MULTISPECIES: hypothetical protein [unclassified Imperialibacter]CAD5265091.1 hypothetical protein IMPERIA89_300074 [Imperialibacter sp. 89]CAD5269980.1 hypothetical protein IMPERIA75_360075 [Imperialibacter sp. 75]VVT09577.1 hypothetical protein IMPR6_180076 [Imperialibacter sp. EC-SDR9]